MTKKTFAQAWAEYEAQQAALIAAARERRERWERASADHFATLHWCGMPAPIQIGAAPMSDYVESSALGRSTD